MWIVVERFFLSFLMRRLLIIRCNKIGKNSSNIKIKVHFVLKDLLVLSVMNCLWFFLNYYPYSINPLLYTLQLIICMKINVSQENIDVNQYWVKINFYYNEVHHSLPIGNQIYEKSQPYYDWNRIAVDRETIKIQPRRNRRFKRIFEIYLEIKRAENNLIGFQMDANGLLETIVVKNHLNMILIQILIRKYP